MIIKKAVYKTSVNNASKILDDGIPEFAFIGRSNVGKSSLINTLCNLKSLAKASSTPGKTKMINYFDVNDKFRFVDLPGYGYAQVEKSHYYVWSGLLGEYLTKTISLVTAFVLLDIRQLPSEKDKQMIEFLIYHHLPFAIIVTKADKIAKSKTNVYIEAIAKELNLRKEIIFVSSSQTGLGKDKILNYIEYKLDERNE